MSKEFKYCACGRKIYRKHNSTIWPKMCPNCQLKSMLDGSDEVIRKGLEAKKPRKKKLGKKNDKMSDGDINRLLDDAWSKLVKLRAGMVCEYSGKTKYLQSHHVFSRSNYSTRWLPENGVCLNAGYHTLSSKFSAHKTPIEFIWIKNKRGDKWFDNLRLKAHGIGKLHLFEKQILLQELNKEIRDLEIGV